MSRKIFNYDNIEEFKIVESNKDAYTNTISACGCLFYKVVNGDLYLLLISYTDPEWDRLDDFGGKIDTTDVSVIDAIIRETSEESNDIINGDIIQRCDYYEFYNRQSKYYSIVIEVDDDFFPDTTVFGDFERADRLGRTVNWYKYDEYKDNLAFRLLNNKKLIEFFDDKQATAHSDENSNEEKISDVSSTDSDKESIEVFYEEPSETDESIEVSSESPKTKILEEFEKEMTEERPVKITRL